MPPCHPFRPVPGQCGPNRRGPLPAPPFDPRDYWATRKCVSRLFASLETKLDKVDVVDPGAATEAGKAADAKSTYEELGRIIAKLAEKADKATTLAGYGITDAATKTEIAAKADLVGGKVPAAQLPSYVDDVLEYDTMSAFPATGESGKIYVAKDTNLTYRWSGTQYVEISPSPVLDDTVTETSSNGVKSSGIWSWVKSLLPHWLTSDYTEPATVASVANKRDKDDLAVYEVVRTENTDWTWTSENKELADELNAKGTKPVWIAEEGFWDNVSPLPESFIFNGGDFSSGRDSLVVTIKFANGSDDNIRATATRPRYMDETLGQAKQNQQLAAVATGDAQKPANGDLVKYDATNDRFVKAVAGVDFRDPQDNTCHKTEYGNKWIASNPPEGLGNTQPYYDEAALYWVWWSEDHVNPYTADGAPDAKSLTFSYHGTTFTATRSAVCSDGKRFVTEDVVDGKVSAAVSTNNPAFVSAVRNTPTSGMPEDIPTDWGTFGTVGAALAALAAGLKWCKNILGSLASGYSTFAAWIESKLDRASLVHEYSATSAYKVGAIVYHDGNIYQCKTAIAEGGEPWNAEKWELRKLDDFFTEYDGLKKLKNELLESAIGTMTKTDAEGSADAADATNAVTLNDNAPMTVTIATATADALAVTFGSARQTGGLRICELYILNGTASTDLTFDAAVQFVGTGDSFPACEAGINYFVFAEIAANLWKVTRETLKSITTPTPVAAA